MHRDLPARQLQNCILSWKDADGKGVKQGPIAAPCALLSYKSRTASKEF